MAVPKQHRSKSRQGQRRMHIHLSEVKSSTCSKCGKAVLPHIVCKECGFYRGKEMLNVLEKLDKKERKAKEKEMKEQSAQEPSGEVSAEQLSRRS